MLENVKSFVKTIDERIDELEDVDNKDANKVRLISLWCKYHKISDINAFTYAEIEQR
jgi:ribosomal protein S3AE